MLTWHESNELAVSAARSRSVYENVPVGDT